MGRLLDKEQITEFEYFITYCYFMTNLVHKTIAERIIIDDDKNIRYMSKQNVHQNITGKVVSKIIEYAKENMKDQYYSYFRNKEQNEEEFKD